MTGAASAAALLTIASVLAGGSAGDSPSGERPPAPPVVSESVVVTAERGPAKRSDVPAAVSVLEREDVERLPARTLAEILPYLPGFHAFFARPWSGTAPMVAARGFFGGGEAEYVQLRVDGVPAADAESGLADWRSILAEDIDRIEALRGPASALYGDTALAGVIEVFTRRPPESGAEGEVTASAGSFGTASANGWAAGSLGGLSGRLSAGASRTDGERAHASASAEEASAFASRRTAAGEWRLALSADSRRADDPGALTASESAREPDSSDPVFRFDRDDERRGRASLSLTREDGELPFRIAVSADARRGGRVRTQWLFPGFFDRTRRGLDTWGILGEAQAERGWTLLGRSARTRAGVEISRDRADTDYRAVDDSGDVGPVEVSGTAERVRTGAFLVQDWRITDRVRAVGALRWDRIADRFHGDVSTRPEAHEAWSPRVGVLVKLGAAGSAAPSLFAQVSRAFKAATLDQLFDPHPYPDFQGGTVTVSNPALRPQRARTAEAGLRTGDGGSRVQADASLYWTDVDDEIDFDPATFRYRNIGRSRHRGAEASARFALSSSLAASFEYAWSRVESRDAPGQQLKNVPEHVARAGLTASLPLGVRAGALASWIGRRWADDADRFRLRDAVTLDLRLERGFGPITARLDAWNLADARYEEIGYVLSDFAGRSVEYSYPGAGRAMRVSLVFRP